MPMLESWWTNFRFTRATHLRSKYRVLRHYEVATVFACTLILASAPRLARARLPATVLYYGMIDYVVDLGKSV